MHACMHTHAEGMEDMIDWDEELMDAGREKGGIVNLLEKHVRHV